MEENSKKHIYIQALAKAASEVLGDIPPSKIANEYGFSPATTSTLVKGKKDFYVTTIAKFAETLKQKPSELMVIVEDYLPEGFTFYDD